MTVSLIDDSVDDTYQIGYNRTINEYRQRCNCVGPQLWQVLQTQLSSITFTDSNTIHVHLDTGNDTTGDGTTAKPYLTMAKGTSMCTATFPYVLVTATAASKYVFDDYPYPLVYNAYYTALYAVTGKTIYWTARTLGFTPADANTIYVSKAGSDAAAGTFAAPVLTLTGATGAISKITATKVNIVILDSGTYDETAFAMSGNFIGLYAYWGVTPTITINQNVSSTTYTPFTIAATAALNSAATTFPLIAKFSDDSFVLVWLEGTTVSFSMYKNNDYNYKTKTTLTTSTNAIFALFILPISQNFVVITKNTGEDLYYHIWDKNGTNIKAATLAVTGTIVAAHGASFSDDTWVACWCDSAVSYGYYFATFDSVGTAVLPATYIGGGGGAGYSYINVAIQSNDNMIFSYSYMDGNYKLYIAIFDIDGNQIKNFYTGIYNASYYIFMGRKSTIVFSDDTFIVFYVLAGYCCYTLFDYNYNIIKSGVVHHNDDVAALINHYSFALMKNDDISIIASYYGASYTQFIILDKNAVFKFDATTIQSNKSSYISAFINSQSDIIFVYLGASNYLHYARVSNYYFIGVNITTVNAHIYGVTFDCENQDYLKYLFTGAVTFIRKNCEIKNMSSTYFDAYTNLTSQCVSLLTGIFGRQYDYIHDVYNGDNVTSAGAQSYNCIFLNSLGIDFEVSGTAANTDDITYRHNAVESAQGGFYLVGNGGTKETIYDNWFENVSGFDISAAVALVAYNCICTGLLNNVTQSGGSTLGPLPLNSGALGSSLANLDLKSTAMGDFADSPGLLAASDGTNIGPYNTLILGPADSWTTFTVIKPWKGITRDIKNAGSVKSQLSDGSWSSSIQGLSEVITISHDENSCMTNAEFLNFITMMVLKKNEIRFYGKPTTAPTTYYDCILFFDDTPAHAPTWSLERTGKSKVKFSFARKLTP
jgi:hypothetical protein